MSGPKVTVYYLTEAQRAAILAERLRQQKEREKRSKLLTSADEYDVQLKSMLRHIDQFAPTLDAVRQWMPDSSLPAVAQDFSAAVSKAQITLKAASRERDIAALERKLSAIPREITKLKSALTDLIEREQAAREELQGSLAESVSNLFQQVSATEEAQTKVQMALAGRKEEVGQKLTSVRGLAYLPIPYQRELDAAFEALGSIQSPEFIDNFISIEVTPLVKKCTEFSTLWAKSGKEYQELYTQYEALLEETGMQDQAEMIPFDQNAVEKLKNAIKKLEKKAQEAAEQAYISQALSDVMEEMGYGMWGKREVKKRSGRQFRNELYHYGADTAINVTYSDDGQISMELGKVDHEDRLPTGLESQAMEAEMHQFCDHFHVIEKRLAEKGVKMGSRVMLAPPSAEYAQIINIADFEINQAGQATKKKQKTLGKKIPSQDIGG